LKINKLEENKKSLRVTEASSKLLILNGGQRRDRTAAAGLSGLASLQ
jgi:hypothetical protein